MRVKTNTLINGCLATVKTVIIPVQRLVQRRPGVVAMTALFTSLGIGSAVALDAQSGGQPVNSGDATPLSIPAPVDLATNFTKIAKQVEPAVVNINTEILPSDKENRMAQNGQGEDQGEGQGEGQGQDQNQEMQQFFQRFFGGVPQQEQRNPQQQEERALGSGFIVDPRGYIVTADHVIDKADRIYVKLASDPKNDQGHPATVVGVDKATDIAVIKISVGHPLPTVLMGNSDGAQVGDSVEAIGSPFDLSATVTAGVVSAKNRSIEGGVGGEFKHFIQTDAAINPGNSGGPLLNMAGQVIGVNDAYFTASVGYMGIGFALPSNMVIRDYNQLIGPGHKVVRGSIGISYQPNISNAVAKMYDAQSGVLISSVAPGKAAANAGLRPNDVIVSVDGTPIRDGDQLIENITQRRPGTTVTIGYLRSGQKMTTTCSIDNLNDTMSATADSTNAGGAGASDQNPGKTKLGLTVSDLPPNAPAGLHGVIIQAVVPGSFADELDPQVGPGLVIEGINRKPVENKSDFDAVVSSLHAGDDVVLQIASPNSPKQSALTGGVLQ
jgi:serine protease Do